MIVLSLGSNLSSRFGDKSQNLELAMSFLENYGILIEKKSSFYETPSYPDKKKPKFINVVVGINTNLRPVELASVILKIEDKLERKRKKLNEVLV